MERLDNKNIWNYAQNKPTLIAKDLEQFGVPRDDTYHILLTRGVFKWFAVRRQLIKLKNAWKSKITFTLLELTAAKEGDDFYKVAFLKGYLKAYEECRAEVRALCHSERWQAPDFDRHAQEYLKRLERG